MHHAIDCYITFILFGDPQKFKSCLNENYSGKFEFQRVKFPVLELLFCFNKLTLGCSFVSLIFWQVKKLMKGLNADSDQYLQVR